MNTILNLACHEVRVFETVPSVAAVLARCRAVLLDVLAQGQIVVHQSVPAITVASLAARADVADRGIRRRAAGAPVRQHHERHRELLARSVRPRPAHPVAAAPQGHVGGELSSRVCRRAPP
jgi:hypothetical protein